MGYKEIIFQELKTLGCFKAFWLNMAPAFKIMLLQLLIFRYAIGITDGISIRPPLWSRLKYLNIYAMWIVIKSWTSSPLA